MLLIDLPEVESMMTLKVSKISCKYLFSREEKEDSKYQFVYLYYLLYGSCSTSSEEKNLFQLLTKKKNVFLIEA